MDAGMLPEIGAIIITIITAGTTIATITIATIITTIVEPCFSEGVASTTEATPPVSQSLPYP